MCEVVSNQLVENVSFSLAREFLHGKGLKKTLSILDEEYPRNDESINRKSTLARLLRIEKHVKKNKQEEDPLKTILEVIIKYFLVRSKSRSSNSCPLPSFCNNDAENRVSVSPNELPPVVIPSPEHCSANITSDAPCGVQHVVHTIHQWEYENEFDNQDCSTPDSDINVHHLPLHTTVLTGCEECDEIERSYYDYEHHQATVYRTTQIHHKMENNFNVDNIDTGWSYRRPNNLQPINNISNFSSTDFGESEVLKYSISDEADDIKIFDVEDLEEIDNIPIIPKFLQTEQQGHSLDFSTLKRLKHVIFGKMVKDFPVEWKIQSFTLSKNVNLLHGIVQKRGGPCGLLACVQAYLIQSLFFSSDKTISGLINSSSCLVSLGSALAKILWKAGSMEQAKVVIPQKRQFDAVSLEKVVFFTDFWTLNRFIEDNIYSFIDGEMSSCIYFLYSAILSRGIEHALGDMDDPTNCCFIGAHGYCTQEMVNLLLTGRATSNAFDGTIVLDGGCDGENSCLKGIFEQSEIGLLTLFEHYNTCQVGQNFKNPIYPIWIVCSESHFSVLYSKDRNVADNKNVLSKFDLYYYDGLANQDAEIKLTIEPHMNYAASNYNQEHIPPLEHCIRTKWKNASVSWNGHEPLI